MWPRLALVLRPVAVTLVLVAVSSRLAEPARASSAVDAFRAGRQASMQGDWESAVRQFTLALADSIDPKRRADALFFRAEALAHLHECERASEDVTALRALENPGASRASKIERLLADCEHRRARSSAPARPSPLVVRLYGGAHRYSSASTWFHAYGAELAYRPGPLHAFVRGGSIGSNDYAGEAGLRLLAPSSRRLRPWIEASAGLQRLRPGGGFVLTVTIPEWDSITTTIGPAPGPQFHGTSLGLGLGVDLALHSPFGIGFAGRWRNVHWKSDIPATLPGDDREIVAYLFVR